MGFGLGLGLGFGFGLGLGIGFRVEARPWTMLGWRSGPKRWRISVS